MSLNRYASPSRGSSKLPFLQLLGPLLESGQISEEIKLSKKQVKLAILKAFNRVFIYRDSLIEDVNTLVCPRLVEELGIPSLDEALNLYYAILECIEITLYVGDCAALDTRLQSLEQASNNPIDESISTLVKQILNAQLGEWREACGMLRPSLPKLIDLDWRVDIQSSSSTLKKNMPPVPSLMLNIHTQEQPRNLREPPYEKSIGMELSKEALHVMMEGLYKIRDQLNNVGDSN